jgi:8-amino-7-oxononanoate synthase
MKIPVSNAASNQIRRRLKNQQNVGPTEAVIDGRRAILFSGNDYLGLSHHLSVKQAAADALVKYGNSAGASRLISGNHQLYRRLEAGLARFKQKEAALVFATGFMANLGLITAITGRGDTIYMDKLSHASLYDGCRLSEATVKRYPHADLGALEKLLESPRRGNGRQIIVTDGVFSMDGDLAPLADLQELADRYDAMLVVDDAHGTGVLGAGGRGTAEHLGVRLDMEIGTLSNALGSLGGYVAGDPQLIAELVNKSRAFIFTTGLPPATVAAALEAITIVETDSTRRTRVLSLAQKARRTLSDAGYSVPPGITPIVPLMIGGAADAVALSDRCLEQGVFVPAIRTPAVPRKEARLRMTVSALHSEAQLDQALQVLIDQGLEMGLI